MTAATSTRTPIYLAFQKAPQVPDEAYGANQRQVLSLLRSTKDGQYPALYADCLCQGSKNSVDEYHDFLEQLSTTDPTRAVHMHGKVIGEMENRGATPHALRKVAGILQQKGRNGDTMLAHITPQEAALLEQLGGAGTRNPETGLLEFFTVNVDGHTREGYGVKAYTRSSPDTGGSEANETPEKQPYVKPNVEIGDIDKAYKDLDFDPNGRGDVWNGVLSGHGVDAKILSKEAENATNTKYGRNGGNDESDAFRHAYWSYTMAEKFGQEGAKTIGDGHEAKPIDSYTNDLEKKPGVNLMDLHNNRVGRQLFEQHGKSGRPPEEVISEAIRAGKLQLRPFKIRRKK